ncbi:MAG: tetratricopeptide repeat protein [Sulfuricurvum sp.]|nr:tetratricopeptide repeat protein [Sulfuricurvum sp.]
MNHKKLYHLLSLSAAVVVGAIVQPVYVQAESSSVLSVNVQNKAFELKREADSLIAQDKIDEALIRYEEALKSDPTVLSVAEKIQLARYYSWVDKLDEGIVHLKQLREEHPDNSEVKTLLARFLSWKNNPKEAMRLSDEVLQSDPLNSEALHVKADLLAWNSNASDSLEYYQKALERGDNFDVRLGYAYAQLSVGELDKAISERSKLTPRFPYQTTNLAKLDDAIFKAKRGELPTVQSGNSIDLPALSYYHDSDGNIVKTIRTTYNFNVNNFSGDVSYRHGSASNGALSNRFDSISTNVGTALYSSLRAHAGVGYVIDRSNSTNNTMTGHVGVNYYRGDWEAGAVLYREALLDTAQLIDNAISMNGGEVHLSKALEGHNAIYGSYAHRSYSDDNDANDLRVGIKHVFDLTNPRVTVGYAIRYLDFERQSGGGYFDPDNFISHQLFAGLEYREGKSTYYLDPYAGFQSFDRYGASSNDFYGGGSIRWRYQFTPKLYSEMNAETGNYALDQAAGYNYYMMGARLNIAF